MENEDMRFTVYTVCDRPRSAASTTASAGLPRDCVYVKFILYTSPFQMDSITTVCRQLSNEGRFSMLSAILPKWGHILDCQTLLAITKEVIQKARQQIAENDHDHRRRHQILVKILSFPMHDDVEAADDDDANAVVRGTRTALDRKRKNADIDDGGGNHHCVICMEEMTAEMRRANKKSKMFNGVITCNHIAAGSYFHNRCLCTWLRKNPSCPLCRSQIINKIHN
ncbi:unnamed protein product [Cuscuta europaea]|uniref:RING-type domain-containing protein n=1 Tax=Cuscuta europaea TaxID=41803 RepID=A0A9P0ZG13_CUSEU|nr:unnamed protein product [Cuscuta europaea]